jgi:hypothetical protein
MPRGKISESSGKLVDTWYFEYTGVAGDDGPEAAPSKIKVPIHLRIFKKYDTTSAPPMSANEVWFTVECEKFKFYFSGTDIEILRAAMWGKLETQFATKWERYFLVQITPQHPYSGCGTGLSFSYEWVDKGTAWDGTLLMRRDMIRHRSVERWPGTFKDRNGNVIACIPVTDANEKALLEFTKRIDELRKVLANFLRPENIQHTLENLSSILLLPPVEASTDGENT